MRTHYWAYCLGLWACLAASPGFAEMPASLLRGGAIAAKVGPVKDNAYAVLVQPDGKILAAGASHNGSESDIAVLRFNANGSIDTSFGDNGVTTYVSKLGDDTAYAMGLQNDGKILVVGSIFNGTNSDFAVLRLLPDGSFDPAYGKNGLTTINFGRGNATAYTLTAQSYGKWIVGGSAFNGRTMDFAVARLDRNGKVDATFGKNGLVTTSLTEEGDKRQVDQHGYSLAAQSDGKILLAGFAEVGDNSAITIVRYLPDGNLDPAFGVGGVVFSQVGTGSDRAYTMVLQPDGKILVGGSAFNGFANRFALVRYLPNGSLDSNFGMMGMVTTKVGPSSDVIYSVALQEDGKILAAGSSFNGNDVDFAVVRYLPNGQVDLAFGDKGKAVTQFGSRYDAAYGVAVQRDGKVVSAGVFTAGADYQFALSRHTEDGLPDVTFGGAGLASQVVQRKSLAPSLAGMGGVALPSAHR